jgi:hypothetical protein
MAALLVCLQGCATPSATAPEAPAAHSVPVALTSASPERSIPMRLSGEVSKDAPRSITVDDLEKLPQTEYSVLDPYSKRQTTYRGVLVRDFVKKYGNQNATSLRIRAVDDFKADLSSEEWNKWDVLLATRTDGARMSIASNGPARIIFPYDTRKDINPTIYNDKWIWQINRIAFGK